MSKRGRRRQASQQAQEKLRVGPIHIPEGETGILADFVRSENASLTESAELSLALDRFLMGDQSLLDDPKQVDRLSRFREYMAKREAAERRYQEDPVKFAEDLFTRADKVRPPKAKQDEVIAKGVHTMQDALAMARANNSNKKLQFRWDLKNGPQREVFVTGVPVNTDVGFLIEPEIINIMGVTMTLKPGKHTIPVAFADRLDQIYQSRKENEMRSQALTENLNAADLGRRWSQISDEMGSHSYQHTTENALLQIPGKVA